MLLNRKKNFCDINPFFYAISSQKEVCKRHLKDFLGKGRYTKAVERTALPTVISEHHSNLIKRGKGIDPALQINKAGNIRIACEKINGTLIRPGEEFSFWRTVGRPTKRKGYRDGRVIIAKKLIPGTGGGLCNLANTINLLVLHSPLDITELHNHSDALAPDEGKRVPFSSGTSVSYNYIDYRFRNNTDRVMQLLVRCEGETLHAELRSEGEFPNRYELTEEGHHFRREGDKYYRVSKIYVDTIDKSTGETVSRKLVRDNHSMVMYDPELIPRELIRAD